MPRILFTNGNGAGPAVPLSFPEHTNLGTMFAQVFPDASPRDYMITVNGAPARAQYSLRENDNIVITPLAAGQPLAAGGVGQLPAANIQVTFLNTVRGGFAEDFSVTAGTTYEAFLRARGITDTRNSVVRIRNNGSPTTINPPVGYVLRNGDLVTVTPSNLSGA